MGRRDELLADPADALVFFGAPPLDDPGVGSQFQFSDHFADRISLDLVRCIASVSASAR
ncbi:hypothetical protein GCM10009760_55800 [Kitasatospora kazusensis]|uniref:Uncharacterized protein n=1 Tax=Kitasatospora kazusensis TaxID=407974 RepID=A0ABN3A8K7_9ACTN